MDDDSQDRPISRRRVVIGGITIAAAGGLHPLRAFARPGYNFTFWRANFQNIRITQVFAQAMITPPDASVRVTQAFAQAMIAPPDASVRVTQAFAQAMVAPPDASVRVTQTFAQALVSIP